MNSPLSSVSSRREFFKTTGKVAAISTLAGMALPHVHAQGSDQIKIALIGCGGRGGGAAKNALSVKAGGSKLVAMADVFENKLNTALNSLKHDREVGGDVEVDENKFLGFDAYKHAMDQLRKGDVAIFTTPLAFRWVHFQYAIQKGLNVFMEKPLTCDGPASRRMLKLADASVQKNMKVGVGLMSRHSRHLQQLHQRIQDGEIGDILLMRGYRMQGGGGSAIPRQLDRRGKDLTEVMFQISRFHSFLWLSGGAYNDFYIHHIDHLCWMKNAWPVKAQGIGGRHYKTNADGIEYVDQNFDSYSVEYTFADGTKMYMDGRGIPGAQPVYNSWAHGTKGIAVVARQNDCTGPSSTYKGQNAVAENRLWQSEANPEERDPYKNEWVALLDAIRNDKPHNEVKRGVEASVTCNMGRMAAHTGQEITFDEALNHEHEYSPNTDKLTADGPSPLIPDASGRYPKPQPGQIKNREYGDTTAEFTGENERIFAYLDPMIIGVPKEIKEQEHRVALLPSAAYQLLRRGHKVLVEANAGSGAGYPDDEYAKAGATLIDDHAAVFREADLIVKVKEPLPAEYPLLRRGQLLFTYLHLAPNRALTDALLKSGVTALAYETIEVNRRLPLLEPMSEIAGRMSVLVGGYYLAKHNGGSGVLLGGVPGVLPGKVVVLGGGVSGINAARMAQGLGADVTILEVDLERMRFLDITLHTAHTLYSSEAHLMEILPDVDLLIGAVLVPGAKAPKLITREMLRCMCPGSVLVDIAIDQGGCAETSRPTTHNHPTYVEEGVIHYCVANMPGAYARTATQALTNVTYRYIELLADQGLAEAAQRPPALLSGINIQDGKVTYQPVADAHGLRFAAPAF